MSTAGRPTIFRSEMSEQAHNYCLLGATNDELAAFFGVSPSTIDNWIARHRDFGDAVKSGRVIADARVARGLYARAVGYDHKIEREVILHGELRPVTTTVHYPPNVQACVFWLRNRRRSTWGTRPAAPDEAPGDSAYDPLAELEAAGERARQAALVERKDGLE